MPTTTGRYQRARMRSSTSQISSSGTEVPMCPTISSRIMTLNPSCGASMIPPATSIRATPRPPVAFPLARRAASSTARV